MRAIACTQRVLAAAVCAAMILAVAPAAAIEFPKVPNPFKGEKAPKGSGYVALTFDDGPKPPVLWGFDLQTKKPSRFPGLLDLLDKHGIKATFFMMGWRLVPPAPPEMRQAALEVNARGHQIENHTYGHGAFRAMARRYGEEWVLGDIERASRAIEELTGRRPYFVRPPEWSIWKELREKIEIDPATGERRYRVVTKSVGDIAEPPLYADVDTEDYRHYELDRAKRPSCYLTDCVKAKIKERERQGLRGHVLVFHELPLSVEALEDLIPWLAKRGYTFVTLGSYVSIAANGGME